MSAFPWLFALILGKSGEQVRGRAFSVLQWTFLSERKFYMDKISLNCTRRKCPSEFCSFTNVLNIEANRYIYTWVTLGYFFPHVSLTEFQSVIFILFCFFFIQNCIHLQGKHRLGFIILQACTFGVDYKIVLTNGRFFLQYVQLSFHPKAKSYRSQWKQTVVTGCGCTEC